MDTRVPIELGGLFVQFCGHQAQSLRAGQVEAASRDAEAVFGLTAQKFRSERGHERQEKSRNLA